MNRPITTPTIIQQPINCRIPLDYAGMRLDQALAALLPNYSRNRLQQGLKTGQLRVDGVLRRPRDLVRGGEAVNGMLEWVGEKPILAQNLPLTVVYEDAELLVVNKPAGLVTHPAAGNPDGTLVNALLHYAPELASLPRAGLVHRLDKDTTGLLVVARSLRAHTALVEQLQERSIEREYLAVVHGVPVSGGTIDAPIGRHPVDRQRMAVTPGGRPAITHYRVMRRFRAHALLRVQLETGRTHQIRVHLAHVRFPLVGDPIYGGRLRIPAGVSPHCMAVLQHFRRQALHACRLTLHHPVTGERRVWEAALPDDLSSLLDELAEEQGR